MSTQSAIIFRGAAWTAISLFVVKGSGLISQLALGWLLSPGDYATFAVVIAAVGVLTPISDSGGSKLLLRRGRKDKDVFTFVFRLSTLASLFCAVLLCVYSVIFVHNTESTTRFLIILAAALLPLGTIGSLWKAVLANESRFRSIATINSTAAILKNGITVVFAFFGFGALSFMVGILFSRTYELVGYKAKISHTNSCHKIYGSFNFKRHRTEIIALVWIMFGALAVSLSLNIDYLVLSALSKNELLGFYFFAFQLQSGLIVFITASIQNVLMPSLSNMDEQQRRAAFVKALESLMIISVPVFIFCSLFSAHAIRFVWGGKWDPSIPVAQALFFALTTRILTPLCRSALEAEGAWGSQAMQTWFDVAGTACAAFIGCLIGDLPGLAISIGIYRFSFGLAVLFWSTYKLKIPIRHIHKLIICLFVISSCAIFISSRFIAYLPDWLSFSIIYLVCIYLVQDLRSRYGQLFKFVYSSLRWQ